MTTFELRQTVRRYLWLIEIGAVAWGFSLTDTVAVTIAGVVAYVLTLDVLQERVAAFVRGFARGLVKAKAARKEPV